MTLTLISLVVAVVGYFCFFAGRVPADVPPQARPVAEPDTNARPDRSFLMTLMRTLSAPSV